MKILITQMKTKTLVMKQLILILFIFLSSISYSQSIISANYYFDAVNGNDSNTGTSPSQAWKTASKFNSTNFLPGTIIAFRDSMEYKGYFQITESGAANAPIVITNWYDTLSGKLPFIEGGSTQNITNASWTETSPNIWRTSLGGFIGFWFVYPDSSLWGIGESDTTLLDEEFEFYWSSPYLYIYSPQNPSVRYPKILTDYGDGQSLSASCFTISGKYIHIKNLEMGYTHGKALKFMPGSDYSKATNITAKFNGTARMKDRSNGEGGDAIYVSASNITVEKCTTYETSGHGYYVWGNSYGTIENIVFDGCVAYNNHHTVGFDVNSQTGSIRNVHFRNNFIYTTVATYWKDWQYFGGYQGGTPGMFVKGEVSGLVKKVYIYNNIFKHITGPSIQAEGQSDSVYILNNTFIETDSSTSVEGYMRNWCILGSSMTQGSLNVKNNIFYAFSNVYNNYIVRAYKNATMGGNLAYRLDGSSYTFYPYDTSYVPPINADPQFVNYQYLSLNPSDFKLQPTSPAINAGLDLSSLFNYDRDNLLRPQGIAWDIGAFEYDFSQGVQDNIPPKIIAVNLIDSITVEVKFSEPVISNLSNYSIDNVAISSVTLVSDTIVRLNTTPHKLGFYTLTTSGIKDNGNNSIPNEYDDYTYHYSGTIPPPPPQNFVFQINTTANNYVIDNGTSSRRFGLEGVAGTVVNIDWGDGTNSQITFTGSTNSVIRVPKTYANAGTYNVTITNWDKVRRIQWRFGGAIMNFRDLPDSLTYLYAQYLGSGFTGAIDSLPSTLTYIELMYTSSAGTCTGSLNNLPPNLDYVRLSDIGNAVTGSMNGYFPPTLTILRLENGFPNLTGNTDNLKNTCPLITELYLYGLTNVSVNLDSLSQNISYLDLDNMNVTGSLKSLGNTFYTLSIINSGNNVDITSTPLKAWNSANIYIRPQTGYGYTTAQIDTFLINYAAVAGSGTKTIDLTGANQPRSSASDAAVATLQSLGRTILTNP